MTYLLDTCILSKLRKIQKYPEPALEKWISKHTESAYYISVLTLGEIQTGISKLQRRNPEEQKNSMILEDWLYGELIPRFHGRILQVDAQIALAWGKLVGEAKQRGILLPVTDGLIAATALTHGLILVTENIKDFDKTGATLLNPWDLK